MTIKLVATDMDATFLDDTKHFDNERFKQISQYMTDNGIYFVSASGNQYYQLKNFFKDYPKTLFVAENGAFVASHSEIFQAWHFPDDLVTRILKVLAETSNIQYVVCGQKSAYVLESAPQRFFETTSFYFPRTKKVSSTEEIDDKILKFSVNCPVTETEKYMQLLQNGIGDEVSIVTSGHGDIDIIQTDINKATGLNYLGEKLNIKPEEMCAFGDGGNDLEMLSFVGHGVAMDNASPIVLKTAPYKTVDNNQQGVLHHLEEIFNI
ncbi:HAD family phosphatase [Companilactobacillus suantsaicola]|uniref:HAD family phosphatase n=1 Tax=Companilactobacillus suantsaicola TaxID=2487723 RepID=A0A4Z0JGU1_9LACO|nr:HAD family hydrolase [Companilactobacillus suantsaicola]TGD22011.1 HAD family phosphatase [Companilactobacillus suantsaicola]